MSAPLTTRIGFAAALSCLLASHVVAQQQTLREPALGQPSADNPTLDQTQDQIDRAAQPREYTANFRGDATRARSADKDVLRYVANCLLAKNQAEVEIGQLAQQQAQTPEVKEFAQTMVQEHGQLVQDLQKLAGTTNTAGATAATRDAGTNAAVDASNQNDRSATSQNAADRNTATTADANNAIDRLMAMDRQIVERCTQAAREELQQKQGVEFDKCYISSQIIGHMHALAALEVIQQQGPQQLQQVAQQAHPKVKQHLDHAKQIMKQLEGDSETGSRAARQPTQTQR